MSEKEKDINTIASEGTSGQMIDMAMEHRKAGIQTDIGTYVARNMTTDDKQGMALGERDIEDPAPFTPPEELYADLIIAFLLMANVSDDTSGQVLFVFMATLIFIVLYGVSCIVSSVIRKRRGK